MSLTSSQLFIVLELSIADMTGLAILIPLLLLSVMMSSDELLCSSMVFIIWLQVDMECSVFYIC